MIALMIALVSCTTANPPVSEVRTIITETIVPSPIPSATAIPATVVPINTIPEAPMTVFWDSFDSEHLNEKWNLLEGEPRLGKTLSPNKEKLRLQIDNKEYPTDFTVQFDLNQCGNDGYLQFAIGNQLRLEFLSDLTTHQYVYQSNEWQELPTGGIHRCAAHIVVLVNSSSYTVLNVHNEITRRILEGSIPQEFYGPLSITLTPYASIDNFQFTIP